MSSVEIVLHFQSHVFCRPTGLAPTAQELGKLPSFTAESGQGRRARVGGEDGRRPSGPVHSTWPVPGRIAQYP